MTLSRIGICLHQFDGGNGHGGAFHGGVQALPEGTSQPEVVVEFDEAVRDWVSIRDRLHEHLRDPGLHRETSDIGEPVDVFVERYKREIDDGAAACLSPEGVELLQALAQGCE